MHVPVDAGDRKILTIAASLLVLTTVMALLSAPGTVPSVSYPSSYSAAGDGAKAAYLLLGELGFRTERWEQSPTDLPEQPVNTTLVLSGPIVAASAEEKWRIHGFVANGGRVLATGSTGAALLPESDLRATNKFSFEIQKFRARLPSPITNQSPEIELRPAVRWGTKRPNHLAHYGDQEGGTVISYRLGKGQVIWWSDPTPLTNYGLTRSSNLMLFVNSIGPPGKTKVLWDEYFHGQRRGFFSYLRRTPTPWMLLQCFLLAAAIVISYSRRSGPVRAMATGQSRLSPLEFIETLGDLYQRKQAVQSALEIAYGRFQSLLLRRLGLPSVATPEEIQRQVRERLEERSPEFFKMLQSCEQGVKASGLSDDEALRLIRELHAYTRRWRLARRLGGV